MWPFLSSSWVAFGRLSYLWAVLPDVPRHWRFPPASGGHPPRLIPPLGGGYCLAPEALQKGECRRGRRYFWLCRTRVGFGPATGPTLKTALCHIRALVGRIDKYRGLRGCSRAFVCGLSSPVVGLHSVGRLTSGRFCRVCLGTGDFLRPQRAIPPGLYPLRGGGVLPGAPKRECRRGWRYFLPCRTHIGFGPATGPTLKTALCHIRALVGCIDKYQRSMRTLSGATRLHEVRVLCYRGCTHLTATSSGRFNNLFFTVLFKGYERSPSAGRYISGGH